MYVLISLFIYFYTTIGLLINVKILLDCADLHWQVLSTGLGINYSKINFIQRQKNVKNPLYIEIKNNFKTSKILKFILKLKLNKKSKNINSISIPLCRILKKHNSGMVSCKIVLRHNYIVI